MARQSWSSWEISDPVARPLKHRDPSNPDATALFVDIKCPNCGDKIEAAAASARKNLRNICTAHLNRKRCHLAEDEQADTAALMAPSKRARLGVVVHKECNKRFEELESRIRGLEHDRDSFAETLISVFPSIKRPITCETIIPQITMAIQDRSVVPRAPDPVPYERLLERCGALEARNAELETANANLREQLGRPESKERSALRFAEANCVDYIEVINEQRRFINLVCTEHNILAAKAGASRRYFEEDMNLSNRMKATGSKHKPEHRQSRSSSPML